MPISPDNFARGANPPSRSPQQILAELLALRHREDPTENGSSIIDALRDSIDLSEDQLSTDVGIMRTGTPEEKKEHWDNQLKSLADDFGGADPFVVVKAMKNLADLLEKAQGNVDISPENDSIATGIVNALVPLIHSRKHVLTTEEEKLQRGEVEYDVGEPPEINAVNQFLFGADAHGTASEEQYIAFLRHGGELLTEWCDHPDIKAPLPKHVRDQFLPEGGISSPP